MPLIATNVLLGIADRAAYQYGQLKTTCTAIQAVGGGLYFTRVSATDDSDVEIPTVADYTAVDNDLLVTYLAKNGTLLGNIIGSMNAHFSRLGPTGLPLQVGGWDGFLSSKNVRVSQYFGELYYAVMGWYMLAIDVFSEGVNDFATAVRNVTPGITFTDGVSFGDGAATNPANGTYFAATQLKIYVVSMGGANLDLRLYVKDLNNLPTTIDVTVPGGSVTGTEVAIGSTSDRFLDVTNIILKPAGSSGTLGDTMKVRNIKERTIAL